MRVAAIQFRPDKGQPDAARAALVDAAEQAGGAGAEIIVCPEMATTGYIWPDACALRPHAEPAQGPTARALGVAAARHRAWVFCGFAERDGAQLYNSMLIIDPGGSLVGVYRKVALYTADEAWASPGRERVLVQTEHGHVVPGICMDLNDPGFTAVLQQEDPRFCAFSTNWVDQGVDPLEYWQMRLQPWSGCFIAANTWGEDEGTRFTGLSTILGPGGEVLARASTSGDAVLVTEVE
jgi:predicted amidohydrolase